MKKSCAVAACVALVWAGSGCGSGTCEGVTQKSVELGLDLGKLEGTTRTYALSVDEGTVSVELTYGAAAVGVSAVRRSTAVEAMAYLSDLLIPSAHALTCAEPRAFEDVIYTVTWSPTDGEPEVLRDQVAASGWYMNGVRRGDVYYYEATELLISSDEVTIELVSFDGDADTLELITYTDTRSDRAFVAPFE